MDDLLRTVKLQKKDLKTLQKDINVKEKLCSALRVSLLTFCSSGYHSFIFTFDCFILHKETDDILGITTQ